MCLRQWLALQQPGLLTSPRFRDKGLVLDKDDVVQVKEAFKWIMQGQVAKELGGVAVSSKVRYRGDAAAATTQMPQ